MEKIRLVTMEEITNDWQEKHKTSIPKYIEKRQGLDHISYKYFNWFLCYAIAKYLHDQINILDVGCGITKNRPAYAQILPRNCNYVGLDPLKINPKREYEFYNCKIEDMPTRRKYPLFLFSSVLDHFEDIPKIIATIQKLASAEAYCIFSIGLHDADVVASSFAGQHYKKLFDNLKILTFIKNYIITAFVKIPFIYASLLKRQYKLKRNIPLDKLHFNYFTEENVKKVLTGFGTIVEMHTLNDTNILLAIVKLV